MTASEDCIACHACCRYWRVEVTEDDIRREPRLRDHVKPGKETQWIIGNGKTEQCVLLGADGKCEIYETRPDACREFAVDSAMCRLSRSFADLPEVVPLG